MDLNDILSETMFRWMNEAEQVIASVGGGRKVFKLEFDCDGMPDIAKEMFDLAQEGAAWQVAIGLSLQKIGSSGDALESGFLKLFSWDPSGLLHDKLHRMEDPASLSCSNFRFGMDSELRDSILQNDWSRQKYTEFFRRRKTCNSRWEKLWRVQTAGESFSDPIILD
ncbi:uncharacterized protein J4E88_000102 [Alternaria novae-zelandiae]|uniref:uncharacterized protein n=1 Tax=Alternaria novae-zelandiae TaxID=430562 RepID=UPI0020C55623|nr:uncharacterized protein J4E88_000102 [Alternaria novae-zelandiae]KAI4695932.1 hypothetical protein J4E88_000102 [Alternaria novae-zelandiae]